MLKEKFLKTFANLPIALREEIILVLSDKGPITWNSAYFEVINNTPLSKEILERLESLKII